MSICKEFSSIESSDGVFFALNINLTNSQYRHVASNMMLIELAIDVILPHDCRYDGNALLSCIEVYNQQTESWELLEKSMTTQRCDAGLTVVHLR